MAVYYIKNVSSDLNLGGADFNYVMSAGTGTASTISASIAKSATESSYAITPANIPNSCNWGTPSITAVVNCTTAQSTIYLKLQVKRISSAGVVMESGGYTAEQSFSTTGNKTFTLPTYTFSGNCDNGDRLALEMCFRNSKTNGAVSASFNVNSISSVTSGIVENVSPTPTGTIKASGQYTSDFKTPLSIGGGTATDGLTKNLFLEMKNSVDQVSAMVTPKVEVRPVGTSFSGVATNSAAPYKVKESSLPTSRRGSVLTYDSLNKRYLAIGGYDGTTRFNELYEIDASGLASKWRLLSPTGSIPLAKNLGGAIQINQNGKSWMFYWGGNAASDDNSLNICDATVKGSEVWTLVTQTNQPTVRSYHTHHLAVVPTSATTSDVYFFGGWATNRENILTKVSLDLSGAVPTALTWTTVTANGATGSPPARSGCFMFYDDTNNRLVVHAGYTGTQYLTDAWQYSLTTPGWTQLSPVGTPPTAREMMSGAYDPVSKRLVIFGGQQSSTGKGLNDIYQLDFSTNLNGVFTQLKPNEYPNCDIIPFYSGSACYDSNRRICVEWGQFSYDGTDKYLYAFDFNETVSAGNMTLYGLNMVDYQRARDAPAYCTDSDLGLHLMINGFSGMPDDTLAANSLNGDHTNEIWAYNPNDNTVTYRNSGFLGMPYKEGVLAVYDSVGKRVLCFGGLTGANQVSQEVWELKADIYGNYKARRMLPSGTKPDARWLCTGAFDATNNRLVIWGGRNATAMVANEAWVLNLASGDGVWSLVTPTGTAPAVVWQPMIAYDQTRRKLYISSGSTNYGATTFSTRTDCLDISSTTPVWSNINTTGITAVRGGAMAYDSTYTRCVYLVVMMAPYQTTLLMSCS